MFIISHQKNKNQNHNDATTKSSHAVNKHPSYRNKDQRSRVSQLRPGTAKYTDHNETGVHTY